jgi:CDP-diacylglycerol--serine O-phosphatidyltransferase
MSPKPFESFDPRNLLTYVSLLCGIGALAAARGGNAPLAGLAVALAVIADTFDGRFARRFGPDPQRRALGVELDSLADAIAFGIAPPLCAGLLLNVPPGPAQVALWAATFVYAACAITRLASYNVSVQSGSFRLQAEEPLKGFIGVPVPIAALIWSSALLVHPSTAATTILIVITAAAMVLPLRLPKPTGVGLGLFVMWPLAVAVLHALGI